MAAAARSLPSLEVTTAADIMDLHSDDGLDFGDGDIDIELHSTGEINRQDDDLSLHDAGTDLDLDVQTAPADQDDFMVDNEDLIEEDELDYDVNVAVDAGRHSTADSGAGQLEPAVAPEEDLIDYSDDEEQPMWDGHNNTSIAGAAPADYSVPAERDSASPSAAQESSKALRVVNDSASADEYKEETSHSGDHFESDQPWQDEPQADPYAPDPNIEPDAVQHDDNEEHPWEHEHQLDADEEAVSQDRYANLDSQVTKDPSPVSGHNDASVDVHSEFDHQAQYEQRRQEILAHPVTVNYEGSELWLFKQHDYEESGDFLLEDESMASTQICNLFNACRTSLGPNITDDIEIGLRFDHLHNMELYQDSTPCAVLTLEELVSLYLQLHAHDGTTEPESFYVTLLFRPRVLSMFNELKKAVAEGTGYTALNNAINSGQTAFSARLAHDSPEQRYDWEDGEEEQESHEDEYHEEHREKNEEDHQESHDERQEVLNEEQHLEEDAKNAPQPHEQYPDNESSASRTDSVDNRVAAADDRTSPADSHKVEDVHEVSGFQPHAETTPAKESNYEEEDLIDYSDDEDQAEVTEVDQAPVDQPSSSSSTVQGDDTFFEQGKVQGSADHNDFPEDGGEDAYQYHGNVTGGLSAQYQESDRNNDDQVYGEGYNEGFDQAYEHDRFANADDFEGFPAHEEDQGDDENTNYYDNFGEQDVDQQVNFTLTAEGGEGGSLNAVEPTILNDGFNGDDLLDFDNADATADISPQDQVGGFSEDEIDYDDEDGAVGQAPVDASAAADPVAGSSSGLKNLSPQGQKRSIDDVGNDVGYATNPTGTLYP